MKPTDLYKEFEIVVSSAEELFEAIEAVFLKRMSGLDRTFVYRGVANADYGFHSSLYRRLWWTDAALAGTTVSKTTPPDEASLAAVEHQTLADVHRWGLHDAERGRLSVLRQLAVLQHNHAPTRLIDVSFNLWVGVWFAVEQTWQDGSASDTSDGRLFLIDVTNRLINEDDGRRSWEDANDRPWSTGGAEWREATWAWRPSPADRRIAAQQGAFLLGGVPSNTANKRYPKSPSSGKDGTWLRNDELRTCTSLPLRFHVAAPKAGGVPKSTLGSATYTIRIRRHVKASVRERLQKLYGFSTRMIYPDIAGYGRFGTPWLLDAPPE